MDFPKCKDGSNEIKKDRKQLSLEKKEELFEEFSGSVERMINEKKKDWEH